jgi:BASS family bile acid:Na+ symporter
MIRFVERYFWALCVAVTLLGLLLPQAGWPFAPVKIVFLAGILFFTGLKIDFRAALAELKRPGLLAYVSLMMLVVLPLGMWGLSLLIAPRFAVGVLIVAAMPAGLAGGSLSDIIGGNAALALVVTLVTSVLCPLLVPWVIAVGTGGSAADTGGLAAGGWAFLLTQALWLAAILFSPLAVAYVVRRLLPGVVARFRPTFTALSIVSLCLLILGVMSDASADFLGLLSRTPWEAVRIIGFMFLFSAVLHVAGYFLAPWRPPADRAALSINAAYVNNGLAMVFAGQFFAGSEAVLPAVLLEIPMVLAILPLKAYLARRTKSLGPPPPPGGESRPLSQK